MITRRTLNASAVAAAALVSFLSAGLADEPVTLISPEAEQLARFYDSLGVETKWPAGVHVNWETGQPDGGPVSATGKHTHCSAFVGSVAKQLGIYILRPPEHGQILLANAQLDWLETAGRAQGWLCVADAVAAQAAANRGMFVVASYRNHTSSKPGHIAIIRPSAKSIEEIKTDGPDIIQAGLHNYTCTTLAIGFTGHPLAWSEGKEVRFYTHDWNGIPHLTGGTVF